MNTKKKLQNKNLKSMRSVRWIALFLSLTLLLIIHLLNPAFFPEILTLLAHGDIEETAAYIASFGSWALFFSFWLTLFINALGFPPAIIFSTANTLIFGIVPGIVLSCIAETVGVVISFLLLRFLFRESAHRMIEKSPSLSNIEKYSGKNGFIVMLIARMVPYIPSALLNALGAVSAISLRDYTIASLIGKFPSTSIEAIIGHDAIKQTEDPTRIILAVISAIVLIGGAWLFERRQAKKST